MKYFDCHADTLTQVIKEGESLEKNTCDIDLQRIEKFADTYTQIFAIWKNRKEILPGTESSVFRKSYEKAIELLQKAENKIRLCTSAKEMEDAHQNGKAAAFLSVEDVSIMGKDIERIRELGFLFVLLSWNYENEYACGASMNQAQGFTYRVPDIVKFLLPQGIVLDISHLSDRGVEDLFQMTDKPIIASHSNVRALCNHPRNLKKEQIQELKTDRNQLNHKMQDMIQEKNEKEGAINNQQKIYQIRKVFSPLPLEIEEEKQPVSEDMIQIEKEIHEFQMILREKEEKITKLHDYQKGLEETCLFAEEFVEREDQKILFVPAFEQLMGYVKKLYPTQRINYQDSSESSKVCMTFSFLKGFQAVLESLLNEIGVFVLNFEMNIDKYKILINIEAKPKVIKNAKDFYEKRSVLENKLTKEFSIERWKTNAVVIQTMIEM